jgi:predicted DNA-binding ribbon-helix-helix protein
MMKSAVRKRSILIGKHKTSVSLEDAFWLYLQSIAKEKNLSVSAMIAQIDGVRGRHNLSSALRLYVLGFYRSQAQAAALSQAA